MRAWSVVAGIIVLLAGARAASAADIPVNVLPPYTSSHSCIELPGDTVFRATGFCEGRNGDSVWLSNIALSKGGAAYANVSMAVDAPHIGAVSTSLKYYFNLRSLGKTPIDSDPIPINIDAHLDGTAEGLVSVYRSSIFIKSEFGPFVPTLGRVICSGECGTGSGVIEYDGTLSVMMSYVSIFSIELQALAIAGPGVGNASARADPYIYVDPSFTDAANYQIVLSEGIENGSPTSSAVPEPASWAMMIVGLGMAGGAMRRSRQRQSSAGGGFA